MTDTGPDTLPEEPTTTTARRRPPAKKSAAAPPQEQPPTDAPEHDDEPTISKWTFTNHRVAAPGSDGWLVVPNVPTRQDVIDLLTTLPEVWGVKHVDFADFVQALPSTAKFDPRGQRDDQTNIKTTYTLYFSVAGRQAMLNAAQEHNQWTVETVPEPVSPRTGIPGILILDDAVVYRESLRITDKTGRLIGNKSGTAWVPAAEARRQAAASNPFEKVETAARGRALAAWGFGVLPGSGVASLEEMQNAAQIQRQQERAAEEGAPQPGRQSTIMAPPEEDLTTRLLTVSKWLQGKRGRTDEEHADKLAKFLTDSGAKAEVFFNPETHVIDWSKVIDAHKGILFNALVQQAEQIQAQEAPV
jgi:hypothetical protein